MILNGKVLRGKRRGTELGFPTANLSYSSSIEDGIYLSIVTLDGTKYPSLTFIGAPETFDETEKTAEVYILSFTKDIYDQEISVELLEKIRENKKFDSLDALVKQMKDDTMIAQSYFRAHPVT